MSDKHPNDLVEAGAFLAQVAGELNLDAQMIEDAAPYLLGMTRHVAHQAVRPAAPLVAFLVGYATAVEQAGVSAGQGSSLGAVRSHIARVEQALESWASQQRQEQAHGQD